MKNCKTNFAQSDCLFILLPIFFIYFLLHLKLQFHLNLLQIQIPKKFRENKNQFPYPWAQTGPFLPIPCTGRGPTPSSLFPRPDRSVSSYPLHRPDPSLSSFRPNTISAQHSPSCLLLPPDAGTTRSGRHGLDNRPTPGRAWARLPLCSTPHSTATSRPVLRFPHLVAIPLDDTGHH